MLKVYAIVWLLAPRRVWSCTVSTVSFRLHSILDSSRFALFCDIRECYLFLDSRFFATYPNVTYFSIRVFLRHTEMLVSNVVSLSPLLL